MTMTTANPATDIARRLAGPDIPTNHPIIKRLEGALTAYVEAALATAPSFPLDEAWSAAERVMQRELNARRMDG